MPCEFVALIAAFAPPFSKPVFQHAQVLLLGAILSPGKRTVTQALRVMGKSHEQHFQMSGNEADMIKVPRSLVERLTETLCHAA